MRKSTLIKIFLTIVIICALIYFVATKVDFNKALLLISQIPWYYFMLFILAALLILAFRTLALNLILNKADVPVSLFQTVKIYFASQLVSPLPIGDIGKVAIISKEAGSEIGDAAGGVVTHSLLMMYAALFMSIIGSMYFNVFRIPAIIALLILSSFTVVYISTPLWNKMVDFFTKNKHVKKHKEKLISFQQTFKNNIFKKHSILPNRNFVVVLSLLILSQVIGGLLIFLISKSLSLNLSLLRSLLIFSAADLIKGLLSIIPGGLGVTEGGMAGLLLSGGVSINSSAAIIILYRLFTLVFYLIIGLLFFTFFYRRLYKDFLVGKKKTPAKKEFSINKKGSSKHSNRIKTTNYLKGIVLIIIVFVITPLSEHFIQTNSFIHRFDAYFYNLIVNGYHSKFLDLLVWPIDNNFLPIGPGHIPSYFEVMILLFLVALFFINKKAIKWAVLALVASTIIINTSVKIDNRFSFRERPYYVFPNNLTQDYKNALKNWNSYPSGHVRDTVIYSIIIAGFIPETAIPLAFVCLFVAYSRVYTGAHFPTDVISGWLVGIFIGDAVVLSIDTLRIKKVNEKK